MAAIVLVGPMGVGKTTIGKKLAKACALPFIDTDQLFVSKHGVIAEFFESKGEKLFRDIEESIVAEAITSDAVVATGGGAVLSDRTREVLEKAFVVYLSTDGRHMASRLSGGGRPLLKNGLADWRRIYESRKPLYVEVADLTVDTSSTPLAKIIEQIQEGISKDDRF
jgi:shikimate kinase